MSSPTPPRGSSSSRKPGAPPPLRRCLGTTDQGLQQLLADTDAALPAPPARGLTAAALDRLSTRRRRRALLVAGLAMTAMALGTAWLLRPRPSHAAPMASAGASAELTSLRARLDALLARVDGLRADVDLEPGRGRAQLAIERAAVAGAQCAAGLDRFDPSAAARQRAQIATLHPDTFAARNLPTPHQPEEHR